MRAHVCRYWHTLPYLLIRSTRPVWVTVPMLLSIEVREGRVSPSWLPIAWQAGGG
jgi:hypothetical protein